MVKETVACYKVVFPIRPELLNCCVYEPNSSAELITSLHHSRYEFEHLRRAVYRVYPGVLESPSQSLRYVPRAAPHVENCTDRFRIRAEPFKYLYEVRMWLLKIGHAVRDN